MKKLNKKTIIAVCGGMLVAVGAYLNYLRVQPKEQMSDLTLANIEAMAVEDEKGHDVSGGVTCEGEGHIWCPLTNMSDYYSVTIIEFPR